MKNEIIKENTKVLEILLDGIDHIEPHLQDLINKQIALNNNAVEFRLF